MPFDFDLLPDPLNQRRPRERELDGEDIALRGGVMLESKNGDILTVKGRDAAKQSVVRELPANPGSLPRRPEWGGGLSGLLMKGVTSATLDRAQSRSRARLMVNPRIARVNEVIAQATESGMRLTVRADTLGGFIDEQFVVKPPGVR